MGKRRTHIAFLGLGTNLGDRQRNLNNAIERINNRIGTVVSQSDFIVTEPVGFISKNSFLNAAVKVKTEMSPTELLQTTQQIERDLGRSHKSVNGVYSDRIIDIDILVYDDVTVYSDYLTLPHPRMKERRFVLEPLCMIAPDLIIPGETQTIAELLDCIS